MRPLDSVTVPLDTLVLPVMKVRLLSKFTSSQYTYVVNTYPDVSISDHFSLPQEYSLLCLLYCYRSVSAILCECDMQWNHWTVCLFSWLHRYLL